MTQKQAWGEDRVYFQDKAKRLHHIPLGWTSVAPVDTFKAAADGRCRFRIEDLLRMADLVEILTGDAGQKRKRNYAGHVKKKTPSRSSDSSLARSSLDRYVADNRDPRRKQQRISR